jgi:hypothetical protein
MSVEAIQKSNKGQQIRGEAGARMKGRAGFVRKEGEVCCQ